MSESNQSIKNQFRLLIVCLSLCCVLRYAGAPIATRVFFPFVYSEMSLFPSTLCTITIFSLYGEYVVRSFLLDDVFLPCDIGLDF